MPTHRAFVHTEGLPETQHRLAGSVASYYLIYVVVIELSVRLTKDLNLAVRVHPRSR